jgi:hypothetical protein
MDLSVQRQQVTLSLRRLDLSLERLIDALAHRPVWMTLEATADEGSAVRQACEAYAAISYAMDDPTPTSLVCLGVIGVPADIVQRAKAVNAAKAALKKVCAPLQGIRMRVPVKGESGPTKAIPVLRVILRNIQRSDLNLLAAYRKIPLLAVAPTSVTYTRAHTRAVYRKSVEQILQLLANAEGPGTAADRARLETLSPRETHLAFVKERYQNIRANVLYSRLDPRGRGRIQIVAELPLMYALTRQAERPEVQFPPPDTEISNQPSRKRSAQIEDRPFLQSLPAYRYKH